MTQVEQIKTDMVAIKARNMRLSGGEKARPAGGAASPTRADEDVWVSKRYGCSEILSPELSISLPVHKLVLLCLRTAQI